MKTSLRACATLAVALVVGGCNQKPVEPKPLPTPPSITAFSADQTRVGPGDAVTLSFKAANATEAEVLDQNGNKVELTGDATQGSGVAHPMVSSFYVLKVTGEGGKASAFVQVAVNEDLKSVFLVAVPPQIDSGESAQLIWSAFRAKSAVIHASNGEDLAIDASQGSGVMDVKPARSVSYQLVGTGVDAKNTFDQTANVSVRPVIASFTANPPAAKPGEKITLSWTTRGAAEVTVSEASFGELKKVSVPADEIQVDQGSYQWTVPTNLPNGDQVLDGFPLNFTLTVKQTSPEVTLTRSISSFAGEGPQVVSFDVPDAVTNGLDFQVSWKTLNATRVQIFADGGLIYEPLVRDQNAVSSGSISLKAPQQDTTFQIVAWGIENTKVQTTKKLRVVAPPQVTDFNLPVTVASAGDPANATWHTTNATRVVLRVKNGPAVYSSAQMGMVASGTTVVYPGVRATFVLEAYNDAGQMAKMEKTVAVGAPGTFAVSPTPTTSGDTLTLGWSFDPATTAGVIGDPNVMPVKSSAGADWFELDGAGAQPLTFDDQDNAVAMVPVPAGFSFPFFGITATTFYASTNGFVSFDNVGALPDNQKLDDFQKTVAAMVAPFWDDLVLGPTSEVLYAVDGTSFPRRLVVQWNDVHTAADPEGSALTFQVQLSETGVVRFAYKTLNGGNSAGESASIGYRANGSIARDVAIANAPSLVANDEWVFFDNGNTQGTYTVTADAPATYVMFTRTQSGKYVVYPARANVFRPNSVLINELMLVPDLSTTGGQWVELYNTTGQELDLTGTKLTSAATMTEYEFPMGTVIPANGYLVVGQSTDPLANGDAHVNVAWNGLNLDPLQDDTVALTAGAGTISSFGYKAASVQPAISMQGPEKAIDTNGARLSCTRSVTFGTNGAIGTPGGANETCFEYSVTPVGLNYEDISSTGTALFAFGAGMDEVHADVDISSAPFPYSGAPQTSMGVSSNGLIAFPSLTSSYSGNDTKPSTSAPNGTLAVFWDDLDNPDALTDYNVFAEHRAASGGMPGRWIVQWKHFTRWNHQDTALDFEAKLFDDGTIEYHYLTATGSYGDAHDATIWLERLDGTAALAVSVNTAGNWNQTALRFTPKQQ